MVDEIKPQAGATSGNDPSPVDGADETPKTELSPEELRKALADARKEAAAHRRKLRDFEAAQQTAEEKRLAEQGEFKTLAEKRAAEAAQARLEAEGLTPYKKAFEAMLEARIKAIPDTHKSLIPKGMSPIQLSEWLDTNWALLTQRAAPNLDGGAGGGATKGSQIGTKEHAERVRKQFRIE